MHYPAIQRARRSALALISLALVAATLVVGAPRVALAATGFSTVTVTQTDGSAPWDATDSTGYDSSGSNGIVRTNDTITYLLNVGTADSPVFGLQIVVPLPLGVEMNTLPAICLAGSHIDRSVGGVGSTTGTPVAAIPAPANPIDPSADPMVVLGTQTLFCELGDLPANAAVGFSFVAKVRPEMANGTTLQLTGASVSGWDYGSDGGPGGGNDVVVRMNFPDPAALTVTSIPKFNIGKNGISWAGQPQDFWLPNANQPTNPENTGYIRIDRQQRCQTAPYTTFIDGIPQQCFIFGFPILIDVPSGGKGGISAANGTFTFTDALKTETLFPAPSIPWDPADLANTGPTGYGAVVQNISGAANPDGCSVAQYYSNPNPRINPANGWTAQYSVRDSGSMTCTQAAPGEDLHVTITNADTSAYTVPSQANYSRIFNLDPTKGYVFSGMIFIEVPVRTYQKYGIDRPTGRQIRMRNTLTNFDYTPIVDTAKDGAANVGWDDYRQRAQTYMTSGEVETFFSGMPGDFTNTAPAPHIPGNPAWWGPPGPTGQKNGTATVNGNPQAGGDGVVVKGEDVIATQFTRTRAQSGSGGGTSLMCTAIDTTKVALVSGPQPGGWPSGGVTEQQVPSRYTSKSNSYGAVWVQGSFWNGMVVQPVAPPSYPAVDHLVNQFHVQYAAAGPASAALANGCPTANVVWYDDPNAVPGNDPALAAQGIYTGVTLIKTYLNLNTGDTEPMGFNQPLGETSVAIALHVLDVPSNTPGTIIPMWSSGVARGYRVAEADLLAAAWTQSTYDPLAHQGAMGDRLTITKSLARITKEVWDAKKGAYVTTDAWTPSNRNWVKVADFPVYSGNNQFTYRLTPRLVADSPVQGTQQVIVEDCLPKDIQFVSATKLPLVVMTGTPFGASITCQQDETYLRWDLGQQQATTQPGVTLAPIEVTVDVLDIAQDGVRLNTAVISATDDVSIVAQRTARARITIENPGGIKLAKRVLTPLLPTNSATTTSPRLAEWQVVFSNVKYPEVSNPDVIDVLPYNGDKNGTQGGTKYDGTHEFWDATVTTGTANILYTKAAPAAISPNPRDPSNDAGGATVWCTGFTGGTCPASAKEVTGLRFQRPGPFVPGDEFRVNVRTAGKANKDGNLYVNPAEAVADGLQPILGPVFGTVHVIASPIQQTGSIGDFVWADLNHNGIQDAGEPGIPGVEVRIAGLGKSGVPVAGMVVTDANGFYRFAEVSPGNYTVTFANPAGYGPTVVGAGTDAGLDSDGPLATLVLNERSDGSVETNLTIDAGFAPAALAVTKAVVNSTRGDGPTVRGDVLTYTVTATNTGAADYTEANPAHVFDDLTDVLDEARFNDDATATLGTAFFGAPRLRWTGALKAGETVTITYSVTITDGGNRSATNIAFHPNPPTAQDPTGSNPPADNVPAPTACVAPTCASTTTAIGGRSLAVTKSVVNTTDGDVSAGDVLTYTVTATNTSARDFTVADPAVVIDDLTGVLDDATLGAISSDPAGVQRIGNQLVWSGPLTAGATVTITYSVTVGPDGVAGADRRLINVAFVGAQVPTPDQPVNPPSSCVAPACASTDDMVVPTPQVSTSTVPQVTLPIPPAPGVLPRTGSGTTIPLAVLAGVFVIGGWVLVQVTRRRRLS